jgi:hypothetical protein
MSQVKFGGMKYGAPTQTLARHRQFANIPL